MPTASSRPLVLAQARVIDPARNLDATGSVIIADGKILAAGPEALNQGAPDGAETIDCRGRIVAPGLVDMRVFVGERGRNTARPCLRIACGGGGRRHHDDHHAGYRSGHR